MRVAIVGAGIAGLATAHALRAEASRRARTLDLTLFEAGPRAGGRIRTTAEDSYLVEWAANGFRADAEAALKLVGELGLAESRVDAGGAAARRYVYSGGKLHLLPRGPLSLLGFDALSLGARLRVLAEPFFARRVRADESVHTFAARHVGEEAAERLIGAAVRGIYAGDARKLSLDAALPRMRELESKYRSLVVAMIRERSAPGGSAAIWSLAGGMESLVRSLAEPLGSALRTRCPALALERLPDGAPGGPLSLRLASGETAGFDAVILATPVREAATLLRGLNAGAARPLQEIESAGLAVAALALPRESFRVPPDGYGFLVAPGEDLPALGALYESNLFPGRAPEGYVLVRVMMGGVDRAELLARSDADLVTLACQALDRALGLKSGPVRTWVIRQERSIPQYALGHRARIEAARAALAPQGRVHLVGNAYAGISLGMITEEAGRIAARVVAA